MSSEFYESEVRMRQESIKSILGSIQLSADQQLALDDILVEIRKKLAKAETKRFGRRGLNKKWNARWSTAMMGEAEALGKQTALRELNVNLSEEMLRLQAEIDLLRSTEAVPDYPPDD